MSNPDLAQTYRAYIDCLNRQDWPALGRYVHDDIRYNGAPVGLAGYRSLLEGDFRAIPDLRFTIDFLVCEPPRIASRLLFDCAPTGILFGYPVNGRRVVFTENVFYDVRDDRIGEVWSVIDKAAIGDQL